MIFTKRLREPVMRGEITNDFYIIKKGKVKATFKQKDGITRVQELPAGGFFGEISLLESAGAEASIKAIENGTEVLTIPGASFQQLLQMQPLLKKGLMDAIAKSRAG